MSKVPEKDISVVMSAFKEFYDKNLTQGQQDINVKAFMDFMEPKFASAGYRKKLDPNLVKIGEGNFLALKNLSNSHFNLPNPHLANTGGHILILTDLGVGDFMVSTGAIREIRRVWSESRITLLCTKKPFTFAEICPYVDEVILCEKFSSAFPQMYELGMETASRLLEQRFDICFCFPTHPYTDLLMYMSGADFRLTPLFWRSLSRMNDEKERNLVIRLKSLATKAVAYGGSFCNWNMANRYFSLVEEVLHVPILNRKLEAWYTPGDFSVAKASLGDISEPLYSLCMGGTWGRVHYPPEKYARLLELIAEEEPTAHFVILGGGNKDLKSAEILKAASPELYEKRVVNLVNKLTYRQSAVALSFCKMHIGNDTGTSHVAAGVNCPVLSPNCFAANFRINVLDAPARWSPYGVPSVTVQPERALPACNSKPYGGHGCKQKNFPHCITQIAPETLFKGFHLLKERAEKKITEPLYIS